MDRTTAMLVEVWAEHQATKPIASDEDDLLTVDHLRRQMDAWQAKDDAFRLLVGTRLADAALREARTVEGGEDRG